MVPVLRAFEKVFLIAVLTAAPLADATAKQQVHHSAHRPTSMKAEKLAAVAEPRKGFITDRLQVPLRAGPGSKTKVLKVLGSGAPLAVLGQDSTTGLSHVQLPTGEKGWLQSQFVVLVPLESEQVAVRNPAPVPPPEKSVPQLQAELQRQNTELIAIRQASANALQIQAERDKLQESVIILGRELETLRREKNALDSDYRQDWFLVGAAVLFAGILIGAFLPRLSWRKKSSWDSF